MLSRNWWVTQSQIVVCDRSEEHTSELQSLRHLVCRLLLEKKKKKSTDVISLRVAIQQAAFAPLRFGFAPSTARLAQLKSRAGDSLPAALVSCGFGNSSAPH